MRFILGVCVWSLLLLAGAVWVSSAARRAEKPLSYAQFRAQLGQRRFSKVTFVVGGDARAQDRVSGAIYAVKLPQNWGNDPRINAALRNNAAEIEIKTPSLWERMRNR